MSFARIGVIGAGVMGEAVIHSLLQGGILADSINVVERLNERKIEIVKKFGVTARSVAKCDVIFLVVKPQDLAETLIQYKAEIDPQALIVSFVAGKKLKDIESKLHNHQRVIRVMPNLPITVGKGFAGISEGASTRKIDVEWLSRILSSSSKVITVPEDLQDAVVALSGSGPAYFFAMVEAMAEAGEKLGLGETDAKLAAQQVLIGAAALVESSGKDPKTLRENVTSQNGTTFAALSTLEHKKFSRVIFEAMKSARDRSIELSK